MSGIRPSGPVGQFFAAAERELAARSGRNPASAVANQAARVLDKATKATGNVLKAAAKEGVAVTKQVSANSGVTKAFQALRNADSFIDNAVTNGARSSPPADIVRTRTTAATFAGAAERYRQEHKSPNVTGLIKGAAELAQFVWAGYNNGKLGPVSIARATLTQGGKPIAVHLVGISGLDLVKGQSTSVANTLPVAFDVNNPMFANAKAAILASIPKGANLVLAGHSLGGMVAQQLAADKDIQARYNVMHTVTFGSPKIETGKLKGSIQRIAADPDFVTLANPRSLPAGLGKPSVVRAATAMVADSVARRNSQQQMIDSDFGANGLKSHLHDYTNESNPQLKQLDALGRKVAAGQTGATLQFDTGQREFFTSPVNPTGHVTRP